MVEHVNILDADRHEAKGASTALVGQILRANGNGTTSWVLPNYADLANKPTAQGYVPVLYSASNASSQQPSALNTPIQIEFGSSTTGTGASLAANGVLTFTQAGQYLVNINFRVGRTGGSAGVAKIFTRVLVNGVAQLRPAATLITGTDIIVPFSQSIPFNASANDQVIFQLYRDSTGVNEGGLVQITAALAGWDNSPSASISVSRFGGLV